MQKVAGNTTEVADQLVESPKPGSLKFHQGEQSVSPSQLGGCRVWVHTTQTSLNGFKK